MAKRYTYEELVDKVAQARYTAALSDSHSEVMAATRRWQGYEKLAKDQGFSMPDFNTASRDLYLNRVFKE